MERERVRERRCNATARPGNVTIPRARVAVAHAATRTSHSEVRATTVTLARRAIFAMGLVHAAEHRCNAIARPGNVTIQRARAAVALAATHTSLTAVHATTAIRAPVPMCAMDSEHAQERRSKARPPHSRCRHCAIAMETIASSRRASRPT